MSESKYEKAVAASRLVADLKRWQRGDSRISVENNSGGVLIKITSLTVTDYGADDAVRKALLTLTNNDLRIEIIDRLVSVFEARLVSAKAEAKQEALEILGEVSDV